MIIATQMFINLPSKDAILTPPSASTQTGPFAICPQALISSASGDGVPTTRHPPRRAPGVRRPDPTGGRLLTAGLVAAWYASNIGVLLLNKYLLSVYGFVQRAFSNPCASFKRFCTEFVVIVCFHLPPTENHPKGKGQFRRLQLLFRSSKLRRM
jgi:hypothetical protein